MWKGMNGKNDEKMMRIEQNNEGGWSDREEYGLKDRNGIECKKGEDRVC